MVQRNDDGTIPFTPTAIVLTVVGAIGVGFSGRAFLSPQEQLAAINKCYDNSQIALNVAAQHGEELVSIRKAIDNNTAMIMNNMRSIWTGKDQDEYTRHQERTDRIQDQRLQYLENQNKEAKENK